jgi:hypothetical protein
MMMLRSRSLKAQDLPGSNAEAFLDELLAQGLNALHLPLQDLEDNNEDKSAVSALLEAANRRNFPVHVRVYLLREPATSDTALVNALGHQRKNAECPSQPAAQDRCLALCQRIATTYPWASMQLMGLGYREIGPLAAAGAEQRFYSSICFCHACQYGYGAAGTILEHVAREAIEELEANPTAVIKKHPTVDTMLLWRRSVQYGLLRQIKEAVSIPLCLDTAADLRYTGDRSSLTFEEAKGLAAAASVSVESPADLARIAALTRPMPIYCNHQPIDPIFSGCIE